MIRIDLVDKTNKLKHVEFNVVPVTEKKDFTCIPDDLLSLDSAVRLSRKIKAGSVSGQLGKYVWYRLIGTRQDGIPSVNAQRMDKKAK
jgi:hypothetical protein